MQTTDNGTGCLCVRIMDGPIAGSDERKAICNMDRKTERQYILQTAD